MERFYELTYLVSAKLEQKEVESIIQKVKDIIKKLEGKIYEELPFYKVRLGYPINKEEEAYLVSFDLFLPAQNVESLKKEVEQEKNILRHIIFKKKAPKEEAKISEEKKPQKPKKVELEELDKKLEEILE